jgi:hypothetical protein
VNTAGAVPFSPLDEGVCVDATVAMLADISMSGTSVGISMFIGPNDEVIDWIDTTLGFRRLVGYVRVGSER